MWNYKSEIGNYVVKRVVRIVSFMLLLLIVIVPLDALSLKFKQVARISHEEIKVIDLIDTWDGDPADLLKVQNIVIEQLPYQNRLVNIRSNVIVQKVRLHNPNVEFDFPSDLIAVRWQELTLNADIIKQTAEDYLKEHYSLSEEAEIAIVTIPRVVIPNEEVTLTFEKNRIANEANFIKLDGTVLYENEVISVFNILVRVSEKRFVYQANKSIKRGQKIDASDFTKISTSTNPNNPYLLNLDSDGDLIASRFISKGSLLKNSDIVEAPYVQRNDLVNVQVQSVSMSLNYQAISRADGWLGDKIMLQNPDSKQVFFAQVIDKNKVLIQLED